MMPQTVRQRRRLYVSLIQAHHVKSASIVDQRRLVQSMRYAICIGQHPAMKRPTPDVVTWALKRRFHSPNSSLVAKSQGHVVRLSYY